VLWGLQQDLLSRTLLPLGGFRKTEIRKMAEEFGYPALAKKAESYFISLHIYIKQLACLQSLYFLICERISCLNSKFIFIQI
jgi:tRNA U34 2-thiouridine synthase MnmA/TrmU